MHARQTKYTAVPLLLLSGGALIAGQARPPFELVAQSTELGFLQRVGASSSYATQFVPTGPLGAQTKDLRVAAYCRLGEIGTLDSLDSMGRIEDGIMKIHRERAAFWPHLHTHPQWHAQDKPLAPLVTLETREGVVGVFSDTALGRHDFYIALTRRPLRPFVAWTRPLLLPFPGDADAREPELSERGDNLVFSFAAGASGGKARRVHVISLREVESDRDADGWTDIEELRLGLDPSRSDTDRDGIPDGTDPSPNHRFGARDYKQPEVNLLQKAILATFGLSGSRHLLIVGPKSMRVQVAGYAGPVIFGVRRAAWEQHWSAAPWIEWRIAEMTASTAVVEITDEAPGRRAALQKVIFHRVNNEWIVVRRVTAWLDAATQ